MFLDPKKIIQHTHVSPGMVIGLFESYGSFFPLEIAHALKNEGKLFCIGSNKDLLKKISNDAKQKSFDTIEVLSGNIEKQGGIPLRDGVLDLVVIANIFFTIEQKKETLQEAYRLLKKGGRVLFVEWLDSFGGIGPHKEHIVTRVVAEGLFQEMNFELLKEIDAHTYHYALIFKKI
jgi:ubiquinone/menaquinone biosynthesis C-methylase UbiE